MSAPWQFNLWLCGRGWLGVRAHRKTAGIFEHQERAHLSTMQSHILLSTTVSRILREQRSHTSSTLPEDAGPSLSGSFVRRAFACAATSASLRKTTHVGPYLRRTRFGRVTRRAGGGYGGEENFTTPRNSGLHVRDWTDRGQSARRAARAS